MDIRDYTPNPDTIPRPPPLHLGVDRETPPPRPNGDPEVESNPSSISESSGLSKQMQQRIDRARLREAERRAARRYSDEDVEKAMQAIVEVATQGRDNRAKFKAAAAIINHEREVWKHETPAKQEITHEYPDEIKIELVPGEKGVAGGAPTA